jgi:hypothetical protein
MKTVIYSVTLLLTMAIGVLAFLSHGFRGLSDSSASTLTQVFWACVLFAVIVEPILFNDAIARGLLHASTAECIARGVIAGSISVCIAIMTFAESISLVVGYIACIVVGITGAVVRAKGAPISPGDEIMRKKSSR